MTAGKRWLVTGVSALLLGVSTYGLVVTYRALFPPVSRLDFDPSCNLRAGPCVSQLPGGGVLSFGIEPPSLPLMTPLALRVEIRGKAVDGVLVDIVGLNMAMGVNRTRLRYDQGTRGWFGETLIPVCTRRDMAWEAAVWLEDGDTILAVPYRFQTHRD